MKISYAICTHNEVSCLLKLINELTINKDAEDEVVILDDYSTNQETLDILKSQPNVHYNNLNKDYATHKNILITKCSGDYIFQIDADEYPTRTLFKNIKTILRKNPKTEMFRVPRENYVTGIQAIHLKKWNWVLDSQSRINYPDYQTRIFKNKKSIRWTRSVHEYIIGHTSASNLPKDHSLDLIHTKSISKQETNNNIYDSNYNSDGSVK
jgi:glycosyltransferase involved in cell wall biosynthesis|tara:strand:+ start:1549 stop:2178 length:630 start_codon:yes stop_codon:yes gene_type:complete